MGLFICSLLIVLIVKSQVEIQVASSGSQRTVCCEQDTSSKIDEFRSIVENYLNVVNIELINTNDQVKELKVTMTDNQETFSSEQEDTSRKVDELQVTVSQNHELQIEVSENQERVSSEVENAIHYMDELQVAVSAIQETVSSKLGDTRRQGEELQATVSANQETVSSELGDTRRQVEELQVAVSGNQIKVTSEIRGIRRQLEELQVSVSTLVELLHAEATERTATTEAVPMDCSVILAGGVSRSGVYMVQPLDSSRTFKVYCDMETDGGGWTVFQRRQDGSVDFYLDFASYSRGFGNLEGEFWLGNDNLHRLTAQGDYELRVDLSDFEGESRYATYGSFSIADVSDNYRLTVGSYSGTADDSLIYNNNHQFTTKDRDNDAWGGKCVQLHLGAWWYNGCGFSNLNGEYLRRTTTESARGVMWYHWKGWYYSLKTTEMKIRPTPQ